MSMRWMPVACLLIAASLTLASNQRQKSAPDVKLSDDTTATCYDVKTGELTGSQRLRTPVLVSPKSGYRAYAENEAIAARPDASGVNPEPECANTSHLFVAAPHRRFKEVLHVEAKPEQLGNSISLVDWSPDGRNLLVRQGYWQWGSDFGGYLLRIYDTKSRKLTEESLIDTAFANYFHKQCAAVIEALGFSPGGQPVISASPYFEAAEQQPSGDSCVMSKSLWLVDISSRDIQPLADTYDVAHYGKYLDDSGAKR